MATDRKPVRVERDTVHLSCIDDERPDVAALVMDPEVRDARAWCFEHWRGPDDDDEDYRRVFASLARQAPFTAAREVSIDSSSSPGDAARRCRVGDLGAVAATFPAVEDLAVSGVWTLHESLALPSLRELFIDAAEIDGRSAGLLLASTMPVLIRMRASLCELETPSIPDDHLFGLFELGRVPALRELELGGAILSPGFLHRVADSALLRDLRHLRILRCEVEGDARPLGERAARFAHLDTLVLPEDLWSAELARALPAANFDG
jgi:hypothetical protein